MERTVKGIKAAVLKSLFFAAKVFWVCFFISIFFIVTVLALRFFLNQKSSDVAAWVQAVGSIAAICSAVWIARRDSRLRSESESKAKYDAVERVLAVVVDARTRVEAAIKGAGNLGVNENFVNEISKDLEQSQHHMKEVLSIQGIDSAVFTQVFVVRTAVERVPHGLYAMASGGDYAATLLVQIDGAIMELRRLERNFSS